LENLKYLSVDYEKMDSIVNLKNPNLEYLSLSGRYGHEINFNLLSGLKNLKSLYLSSGKVNDVRPLLKFPNLERVEFGSSVQYTDISPLAESNTIKEIEIWNEYYVDIPEKLFESKGITLKINYPGKE
jgi:Leucine-rich repeat (LRR) protein